MAAWKEGAARVQAEPPTPYAQLQVRRAAQDCADERRGGVTVVTDVVRSCGANAARRAGAGALEALSGRPTTGLAAVEAATPGPARNPPTCVALRFGLAAAGKADLPPFCGKNELASASATLSEPDANYGRRPPDGALIWRSPGIGRLTRGPNPTSKSSLRRREPADGSAESKARQRRRWLCRRPTWAYIGLTATADSGAVAKAWSTLRCPKTAYGPRLWHGRRRNRNVTRHAARHFGRHRLGTDALLQGRVEDRRVPCHRLERRRCSRRAATARASTLSARMSASPRRSSTSPKNRKGAGILAVGVGLASGDERRLVLLGAGSASKYMRPTLAKHHGRPSPACQSLGAGAPYLADQLLLVTEAPQSTSKRQSWRRHLG